MHTQVPSPDSLQLHQISSGYDPVHMMTNEWPVLMYRTQACMCDDAANLPARRKVYTGTELIVRYLARLQRDPKQNDGLFLYGHDAESSTEVGAIATL